MFLKCSDHLESILSGCSLTLLTREQYEWAKSLTSFCSNTKLDDSGANSVLRVAPPIASDKVRAQLGRVEDDLSVLFVCTISIFVTTIVSLFIECIGRRRASTPRIQILARPIGPLLVRSAINHRQFFDSAEDSAFHPSSDASNVYRPLEKSDEA
jgi:hypothetical protein